MADMTGYNPNTPASYEWADIPGDLHNLACGFSFVDGHSEMKRWVSGITTPPAAPLNSELSLPSPYLAPNDPDVGWVQNVATRPQ